ncbi:hypothetical protein [Cupriavidus neocaledonicus]|nr:hypothetical protein [Cupriavidus neocaledonicus]
MTPWTPEFALKIGAAPILPENSCYRPPSWPPPADWVVSEDSEGNPLSRWSDPFWDFSAWVGYSFKLHFAGGGPGRSGQPLRPQNQHLMRLLTTWVMWGPDSRKAWRSLLHTFYRLRRIVALCDRENILASELYRFPKVIEEVPKLYSESDRSLILAELDRLLRAKERLGFVLVDEFGLCSISKAFSETDDVDTEQTAYIPPRIWTYQIHRLRECLDDFIKHEQQITDCFNFCVDAYAHNFGSLEACFTYEGDRDALLPFCEDEKIGRRLSGMKFYGPFELTAKRFGIDSLIDKWISGSMTGILLKSLSSYLSLVQHAGMIYIANFTLQRIGESAALRADCLVWEEDAVLGKILTVCGETTKTDPDSDARWPTSPSVQVAVKAMTGVAKLRMRCAEENPKVNCGKEDIENPYLVHCAFEPWSTAPHAWRSYSTRSNLASYKVLLETRYPRLFDPAQLTITKDDLEIALKLTPNLSKNGAFEIGNIWPLAYHQTRRTGAVNMFASGLLSDTSIQVIMKHLTLEQSRYYGKNYSRVRFNDERERLTVEAKYEVLAKQISALVDEHYLSPQGEKRKQEIVVNLLSTRDYNELVKAGRKGEVSFRETRLGGCTNRTHCDYGGIESVARCAGGDGHEPCREAIFDSTKRNSIERQLEGVERRLKEVKPGSPREIALKSEAQGLRNYLNVVRN